MADSYSFDFADFDEYLTEYVDGTMDPTVRKAFEELLCKEPLLLEHVYCLKEARMKLCGLGCQCAAPPGFQSRLRQRLAYEMVQRSQAPFETYQSRGMAAVCYLLILLFLGITMHGGERLDGENVAGIATASTERHHPVSSSIRDHESAPGFSRYHAGASMGVPLIQTDDRRLLDLHLLSSTSDPVTSDSVSPGPVFELSSVGVP